MQKMNSNSVGEKVFDFTSTVVMGEKEHKDFSNITYSRGSTISLVFLIFSILYSVPIQFLLPEISMEMLVFSFFMLLLFVYVFFLTQNRVKNSYKRMVISNGKENITYKTYIGEKIVVESELHTPVEYDYDAVISIKETNQLYLLGLKYNLYIIVEKNIKGTMDNADFIQYMFKKCHNIKTKKVKNVNGKKKAEIICLCLYVALFLFHLIMFLYNW